MSKLSYQLSIKKYQRELELDSKKFNALDVKYSDINLLKQLQILNPIASTSTPAGPVNTGFWGVFVVSNQPTLGSSAKYMNVYFAYNNVPLTSSQQINSNQSKTFNITQANRLPLPGSTLQLKITMQSETLNIDLDDYDGFQPQDLTSNPLDEENTLDILVNANNLDNGQCSGTFFVSTSG